MASIAQPIDTVTREQKTRRAVAGAFAGFFVDMFDVYLPIVALAPASAYFETTGVSPGAATILAAMVFVATLIGRPIGAAIFGHFGDRMGRRKTAIISVSGFGIVTLIIACLPGSHQIGVWAVIVLIVLRLIDGIFLGGEYTAASPLAMEYSPLHKRGYYGGLLMTGFPAAYVVISLVTLLVLHFAPAGDLDSPYVQWGWRIPFFAGAVLAALFVFFYAKFVPESDVWQAAEQSESPLRNLFTGQNVRTLGQVFLMMTGVWFTLYMASAVLPGQLSSVVGMNATQKTIIILIANAVLVGGYIGAGVLSQRTGRRPFFIGFGALTAVVGTLAYAWIMNLGSGDFALVLVLTIIVNLVVVSCWGVVTTYINEAFHTTVRASGYGLGYSLAVIIPSFYAFYQSGLANVVPARYTALVLLVFGGALIIIGASLGPETRDVAIRAEDRIAEPAAGG